MNIFIFGSSCSGKSTLATALSERLGGEWAYLDRDDLVQKEGIKEEVADSEIDRQLALRTHVIVDAQIPWRERKEGELYFLIFAPLECLLKRNALRTERLERKPNRAKWAKDYVVQTHKKLAEMDARFFNGSFNSSNSSLSEEVDQIYRTLFPEKTRKMDFLNLCARRGELIT